MPPPQGSAWKAYRLETTGYCSCGECCGWRRTWYGRAVIAAGPDAGKPKEVGYTASGSKAHPGTIAADTSFFPFGTEMYVPGYGYGRVEDRGSGITGYHIDLFFWNHGDAKAWGHPVETVLVRFPAQRPRRH